PDINNFGTLLPQEPSMFHPLFQGYTQPPVKERIGSDIEYTHNNGALKSEQPRVYAYRLGRHWLKIGHATPPYFTTITPSAVNAISFTMFPSSSFFSLPFA